MPAWIFQGNPDRFDINAYLGQERDVYWSVRLGLHQKQVQIGDTVYIWRAAGSKKLDAGIVTHGVVTEECVPKEKVRHPERLYGSLWSDPSLDPPGARAGVHLNEVRLTTAEGMVTRRHFEADEDLSQMAIIQVRTGTNFRVAPKEARKIAELWHGMGGTLDEPEISAFAAPEAMERYRKHRFRERNKELVEEAKKRFLRRHGKLFCEVCSSWLQEKYGDMADSFIEVHHIKLISKMTPGEKTNVEDLMMICPNCHRLIHWKGDPDENLRNLQQLFRTRPFRRDTKRA